MENKFKLLTVGADLAEELFSSRRTPYVFKGEIDGLDYKPSEMVKWVFTNGFVIECTPSDELHHGFNPTLVSGWPEM